MNMYIPLFAIYFVWKNYYCDILYHNYFEESRELTDSVYFNNIIRSWYLSEPWFLRIFSKP